MTPSIVFPVRFLSLWKPRPLYETKDQVVSLELLMEYPKSCFIQRLLRLLFTARN